MSTTPYYYRGAGVIWARAWNDPTAPLRALCNSSELKIDIKSKSEELQDYDSAAGGTIALASRIEGADVNMTLYDLNPLNLAMAYWGTSSSVVAGTVASEAVKAHKGSLSRLAKAGPTSVVVTSSDGLTTYTYGTDYGITGAGILVTSNSAIPENATIHVSYSYGIQTTIEAMTTGGIALYMLFDGINSAFDNKPRVVDLYKVQFEAVQGVEYKSEKAATIKLKGKLLRDDTQTGVDASKYFRETIVP